MLEYLFIFACVHKVVEFKLCLNSNSFALLGNRIEIGRKTNPTGPKIKTQPNSNPTRRPILFPLPHPALGPAVPLPRPKISASPAAQHRPALSRVTRVFPSPTSRARKPAAQPASASPASPLQPLTALTHRSGASSSFLSCSAQHPHPRSPAQPPRIPFPNCTPRSSAPLL